MAIFDPHRRPNGPLVESLESRRLLAADVAELTTPAFHAKIDFLPITAPAIAPGYRGDNGLQFGPRRN